MRLFDFVVGAMVTLFVGLIVYAVWLEHAHPCLRRGPEETIYTMQSCGKNCWYPMPITSRPCLERAR